MNREMFALLALWIPLLGDASAQCGPDAAPLSEQLAQKGMTLSTPLDADELENGHRITIRESGLVLPFGYSNKTWLDMKKAMQAGDQLYLLAQHDGHFRMERYILVRNGCIIRRMLIFIT